MFCARIKVKNFAHLKNMVLAGELLRVLLAIELSSKMQND
jgi:hypothetical protein